MNVQSGLKICPLQISARAGRYRVANTAHGVAKLFAAGRFWKRIDASDDTAAADAAAAAAAAAAADDDTTADDTADASTSASSSCAAACIPIADAEVASTTTASAGDADAAVSTAAADMQETTANTTTATTTTTAKKKTRRKPWDEESGRKMTRKMRGALEGALEALEIEAGRAAAEMNDQEVANTWYAFAALGRTPGQAGGRPPPRVTRDSPHVPAPLKRHRRLTVSCTCGTHMLYRGVRSFVRSFVGVFVTV